MAAGPTLRRGAQGLALGALLLLFTAQLLGAQLPNAPLLCVAGGAGLALDLALRQWWPGVLVPLGRVRCDETMRQLLRDLLVVVGLAHLAEVSTAVRLLVVAGLLACYALHFLTRALAVLVRRSRTLPVLTRNIDTSELRLRPAPPRLLTGAHRRMPLFAVPATAGMLGTVATGRAAWSLLGVGCSLLLFAGGAARLATWLLPGRRPPSTEEVLAWFQRWLEEHRPRVGLYFSGGSGTAYQVNMWLGAVAALEENALVVLRERPMVQQLAPTELPVVCVPKVAHLMLLEHSTLRVLIHPANAPKTSQVLRIPTIKHAFVNHGESDKLSSCNPYAKVYDEVWVAGPAARERYALADVGVDDRDVVEVGRPQLAPIHPYTGPPPAEGPITVLYAPTWEGWTNDPGNTSVLLAGERLVAELLADARVRLLYRPHPMTGSVDPRFGAADARIRALVAAAERRRPARAGARSPAPAPRGALLRRSAGPVAERGALAAGAPPEPDRTAGELAHRTARLEALTSRGWRPGADDVERMLWQSAPAEGHQEAVAAATRAWRAAFWAAQDPEGHLVLTGPRPDLYSCFNQADLLISDVSSVVADYLAGVKPYAVVNTSGLSEEAFRAANPTVRAATVLSPDVAELPELLAAVVDPRLDRLAGARAELRAFLLGPTEPPSQVRFQQATSALLARAEARGGRPGAGRRGGRP
ncbi:hypothetical protein RM844_30805 [Streptomyces sp. DSM 44915]|uniref:Integral membrane protein n=1 Tax=Streptomyces chisholmiae TaxID=3075540 RepID=A0ABU2K084_9ACTN|nr:hypothetical protein [Streptomyces sp. DSM 44915]MDT0270671.1 hypothetical protein [Streptomyces sp. DSM 44915]